MSSSELRKEDSTPCSSQSGNIESVNVDFPVTALKEPTADLSLPMFFSLDAEICNKTYFYAVAQYQ